MKIRAGKLRFYASIDQRTVTGQGDRGQPVGSWVELYPRVACDLVPLSGDQLEITRQLVAKASHKVTIRYHAGITAGMRVTYQGRHFVIGHVGDGDFRKHYLELTCVEQATGAT